MLTTLLEYPGSFGVGEVINVIISTLGKSADVKYSNTPIVDIENGTDDDIQKLAKRGIVVARIKQ